jgi:hypothetical protein
LDSYVPKNILFAGKEEELYIPPATPPVPISKNPNKKV